MRAMQTPVPAKIPRPAEGADSRQPQSVAAARIRRFSEATGRKNMQLLIQLRWIAVVGQIITIAVVHFLLGITLPLEPLLVVLGAITVFNLASRLRWQVQQVVTDGELLLALLVDVGMLTLMLYFTGGAANPFAWLYLLQITLGAMLLTPQATWIMVIATTLCFAWLALLARPLPMPAHMDGGLANPYMQGMLVCFALNAGLLVTFIVRITRNLRQRDAHLADLRQRAAEEENIVRMGLLASGAAHELGTPLATLAVILGDWARLPTFTSDPELLEEVLEMQAQIQRCKAIVSGILMSAGEARGESSEETSICVFLDELVEEWKASRPVTSFVYDNRFGQDVPVVSDSTLKQTICNILDNALEASPHHVSLEVERNADALRITVKDNGSGFPPEMLAQLGKPYQSSKGRPGRGMGLFLVVNVARTLGGRVTARNRVGGGAVVTLTLPLAAIALEEGDDS
jgi:two-component system sensor histidine kinase RegB